MKIIDKIDSFLKPRDKKNDFISLVFLLLGITRFSLFLELISVNDILIKVVEFMFVTLASFSMVILINKSINILEAIRPKKFKKIASSARVLALLFSIIFFFFDFYYKHREWTALDDAKVAIYTMLMFGTLWNIFVNRKSIKETSDKYLRKLGIDKNNKNFKIIFVTLKVIFFITALSFILKIFMAFSTSFQHSHFKNHTTLLFRTTDFITFLLSILVFKKILDMFLVDLGKKIVKSNNETAKNYLFFIPLASNLGKIFVYSLIFISFLNLFGYTASGFASNLPALIQSIGILGVGLSFIARDSISNFLSGIFILTDAPFSIGDRIRKGDIYGDVIEIGIRTTKIKTKENTVITVPNSHFTEQAVTSYRKFTRKIKVFYEINVAYDSDLSKVKDILYKAMKECKDVLEVPIPKVHFLKYGDHSLSHRLSFWIVDIGKQAKILDELNTIINVKFKEENIEIPYPSYKVDFNSSIKDIK